MRRHHFYPRHLLNILSVFMIFTFFLTLSASPWHVDAKPGVPLREKYNYRSADSGANTNDDDPSKSIATYADIQEKYKTQTTAAVNINDIYLNQDSLTAWSGSTAPQYKDIEGRKSALLWEEDQEFLEWTAEIPQDGFYEILVEYCALGDSSSSVERALYIDGEMPFSEAGNLIFNRIWIDEGEPKVNNIGDEVRPRQKEVRAWQQQALTDHQGMYSEPFRFYLKKGSHKIKLTYTKEPMAVGTITIRAAKDIPLYKDVLAEYQKNGYKNASQTNRFEAENTVIGKNDPTVRRDSDGDPMTSPASTTSRKLNFMGGWGWRKGNQTITWKFSVPEDGLYKIGMRAVQWYKDGLPVYRQIKIDGEVPFRELLEYKFKYDKNWHIEELSDSSGNPFLFYLEGGEHEITMTVKLGPLSDLIRSISDDTLLLSDVIRQIIMLTGSEPDVNFEYELDKKIPDLLDNLSYLSNSMKEKADWLTEISAKRPAIANNFLMISDQMDEMVHKPDTIPLKLQDLNNALNNLGVWSLDLQDHPLGIDYFAICRPEEKLVNKLSNIFQKIAATWQNFLLSFTKDYNNVGSVYENQIKTDKVINVWVSRGTEWAETIKEMADEDFTPQTGIGIKVNILPPSQWEVGTVNALLLAISSGNAPDVALSVLPTAPVEFAIRDATVDLSKFSDFNEVQNRFIPRMMIPFQYNGGVYGLPETMNFKALFYRTDIMSELGVSLPDTWEDVYQHLIPVLYQHGMQFNYTPDFTTFLFQNGGEYYKEGGSKSALDSPEAFQAFREYVELYTNYNIPIASNFFNRMRLGEMPIGVGDYALYVQLSAAAPELAGRWDIAPLPGHKKSDGTIDRSTGGMISTANIILNQSDLQEESWAFLKWWTSEETQAKFGKQMEALIGIQARWNTATVNAFKKLPWDKKHLSIIEQQWEWANEMPVVLGGYFTQRHMVNAWNRVVLGKMNERDSLEQAVKDINRELSAKQAEYGFTN